MKHDLDEHFRKQLEGLEVKPSEDLWARIEPRLDAKKSSRSWYVGIAASITIAFAVTTFISTQYQDPQTEVYPITVEPTETRPILRDIEPGTSVEQVEEPITSSDENKFQKELKTTDQSTSVENKTVLAMSTRVEEQDQIQLPEVLETTIPAKETSSMKVEIKMANPARYLKSVETTSPIIAQNEEDSSNVKEKIFAYAESQWKNLINGEPLEAPHAELPRVKIPIGGILNEFRNNNEN